jgi:signal transduction histidine kinase
VRVHSLTTRFVLTLLLSTAVPFVAFGWFVRGEMQQRLERQVVTVFLSGQAELVAERLDSLWQQYRRDCDFMQSVARLALDASVPATVFEPQVDFRPDFHENFQMALLADATGRVAALVQSFALDAPTASARDPLIPQTVADQPWFQDVVGAGQGFRRVDRHLSPFLHRDTNKQVRNPGDYSLGLAFPVPGDRGPRGAVFALVNWQSFQDAVDRAAQSLVERAGFASARAFLCDETGHVLAHTDRALYNRPLTPASLREGVLSSRGGTVTAFDDERGEARLAGSAAVRDFSWWCGLEAPERELFAASRDFGRLLLLVTALAVAILVAWSLFASRAILRPVRELVTATERIAGGDLGARVPTRGQDELAELGRAFNNMARQIHDAREQLVHAERQAAWAEMARQVAHEIKNPLTPMRMSAQMLLRARRDNAERLDEIVERLARTVLEQTDALARIASDFRHFAGRPEHRLEVIDADSLVEDTGRDFAAAVDAGSLRLLPGAPGARLRVDRQELLRVLMNLVQNALSACGPGGRVELSSRASGQAVVYTVRDDGPGIAPDVRARLFEPYFTTRSAGTGLGLAISKRLVEAHGGRIALVSGAPGRTEFEVELTRWQGEPGLDVPESGTG